MNYYSRMALSSRSLNGRGFPLRCPKFFYSAKKEASQDFFFTFLFLCVMLIVGMKFFRILRVTSRALRAGKILQTRVRRRCLGRVFCDLMHRYVEPGVRTSLQDFTRLRSPTQFSKFSKPSKFIKEFDSY